MSNYEDIIMTGDINDNKNSLDMYEYLNVGFIRINSYTIQELPSCVDLDPPKVVRQNATSNII